MTAEAPANGRGGVWPWAQLTVTLVLLGIAGWSIAADAGETMAGAIIGYVAAYWLPPPPRTVKVD